MEVYADIAALVLLQEVLPPSTGADAPELFAKTLDYVAALCVLVLKRKSIEFEGGSLPLRLPMSLRLWG